MKYKAKRTGRRLSTRVIISGDDRDPQGVWDRLLGTFSDLFVKIFGKIEYERTVIEPDEEIEFEGSAEELRVVKEASEGTFRTMIQGSLEDESASAEKKKLEAGHDPREPMAGTADEQIQQMRELQEFLDRKREEGYLIDMRRIAASEELSRILEISIEELELSVRAHKSLASNGIHTVRDLVVRTSEDLLSIHFFGKASLREVKRKLAELGLELGMKLPEE